MLFSSTTFLFLFFPITLGVYYFPLFRNSIKARNVLLLLASIAFYAWGEPLFVFLMLFSIAVTWMIGLLMGAKKTARKLLLTVGAIYHLCVLFLFKYAAFVGAEADRLLGRSHQEISIALPIGISFFTFQMMSYLFDVYYEKAGIQRNVLNLGLYVALFPQLIAGPIVRYETVANEIEGRTETERDFAAGIRRFVVGLGKKALIADYLALLADNVFFDAKIGGAVGAVTAWIGAVAYSLEIYFDFSGYSDMAIGLGRCFGFHFKENFNYPYVADSIHDFWKRWHISLTDWFRDYVYIPLGGNRAGTAKQIRNICIVWLLTGIWHGANWTFLVWGCVYCFFQIAERFFYRADKWPQPLRRLYTLIIVCVCWVVFRAEDLRLAGMYIRGMAGCNGLADSSSWLYLKNGAVILTVSAILSTQIGDRIRAKLYKSIGRTAAEALRDIALCLILLMSAVLSISGGYSPFIYFNF